MKYTLQLDPKAVKEVRQVHDHRELEKKGSGDHFVNAILACFDQIKINPYSYQLRKGDYRHALLPKLKYRVVYEVERDIIFVYQIRHTSRKPSKKFGP